MLNPVYVHPSQPGSSDYCSTHTSHRRTRPHFANPSRSNTLVIVPPDPQSTNEGNILGHSPRELGIGMVEIKIVSRQG